MKMCSHCQYGMILHYGPTDDGRGAWCCDYLGRTGMRRPCPANNCTVFKERSHKVQKDIVISSKVRK